MGAKCSGQVLVADAANGMAEGGAIEIFAQIHQGQKSVENAGFELIGKV